MGIYAIKMPDIGEGIAEVELVEWRIQAGDDVKEDQVVADVMTDKATVEIPSPVAGKVMELGGQPGQLMAVGAELVRMEVVGQGNVKQPAAAVAAPAVAAATGESFPRVRETARGAPATPPQVTPPPVRAPGERPLASPSVRRHARELGVELQFVHGSGPA